MSGSVLHPEALADLEEIWEFIAAENLEAAARVLDEIRENTAGRDGDLDPSRPGAAAKNRLPQ